MDNNMNNNMNNGFIPNDVQNNGQNMQNNNQTGFGYNNAQSMPGYQSNYQMGSGTLYNNSSQNFTQGPQPFDNPTYNYNSSTQYNQNNGNSSLGVAALIFSVLGCTFLIGAILAIIDLTKNDGKKKTLAKISLGICGAWVLFSIIANILRTSNSEKTVQNTEDIIATETTTEKVEITTEEKVTEEKVTEHVEENTIIKTSKNGYENGTKEVLLEDFSFNIPIYFNDKADNSTDTTYTYYAEKGDRVAVLQVSNAVKDENNISFEKYSEVFWDAYSSGLGGAEKIDDTYFDVNGLKCYKVHYSLVYNNLNFEAYTYLIRNTETNEHITFSISESENTDYSYFEDVEKIVDSVKTKTENASNETEGMFSSDQNNTVNEKKEEEQTTEKATDNGAVTKGMKNALKSAKSYISYSAFSRGGLIKQLLFEKYTEEEATYGADNCGANWNDEALECAKSYINYSSFSYAGLIKQLEFEEFTTEEATYGADSCGADWNEEAAECAKSYLSYSSFSRQELIDQLLFEGFTQEEAEYAVQKNGY